MAENDNANISSVSSEVDISNNENNVEITVDKFREMMNNLSPKEFYKTFAEMELTPNELKSITDAFTDDEFSRMEETLALGAKAEALENNIKKSSKPDSLDNELEVRKNAVYQDGLEVTKLLNNVKKNLEEIQIQNSRFSIDQPQSKENRQDLDNEGTTSIISANSQEHKPSTFIINPKMFDEYIENNLIRNNIDRILELQQNSHDKDAQQELKTLSAKFKTTQEEHGIDTSTDKISPVLEKNPKALARILDEHGGKSDKESSIDYHSILMHMPVDKWKTVTNVANEMQKRGERNTFVQSIKDVFNKIDNSFKNLVGKGAKNSDIENLATEMNSIKDKSPIKVENQDLKEPQMRSPQMSPIAKLTSQIVKKSSKSRER